MMEEDKNWFTKQVTMFNEDAFKLGHAYHLWFKDGDEMHQYNGILCSKGQEELYFRVACTDTIDLDNRKQCDIRELNIKYHDIDKWDFALLIMRYNDLIEIKERDYNG